MQSPQEPQSPPLAQRSTRLLLHQHRRITQRQFRDTVIQFLEISSVDREDTSPDHGFCRDETRHGGSDVFVVKKGVADVGFTEGLHIQDKVAHLACLSISLVIKSIEKN